MPKVRGVKYQSMKKPEIHESAEVHPSCVIFPNVKIGANVRIGPFCIIGAVPESKKGYPNLNEGVIIEEGAVLHGHNTVDGGTEYPTIVGARTWLMKGVHIGHDACIGEDNTIACHALIGGFVDTSEYVNIGLGAAIHQRVQIPKGVMIGMNSTVTKKSRLRPFYKYAGSPVKDLGRNDHLIEKLKG